MKTLHLNKFFVLTAVVVLFIPLTLFAQGGSSGGGSGSGGGDQDQTRNQDRIQDPTTHDGDEPNQDQDRLRDQDRIQDPALSDGDGPDRDRLRDQDCVAGTDCDQDQDRDRDRDRLQIHTPDELRASIQERKRIMDAEAEGVGNQVRNIHQNQNQVRIAANALSSSSDLLGDIGPAVSRIAQDFDNSVQATIRAEEQIQNRSRVARFFFGGDEEVVGNLDAELIKNRQRIEDLNRLVEAWEGDGEVKTILQEQIQNMEQEQERLQKIVEDESESRGLFGFLFGWLD